MTPQQRIATIVQYGKDRGSGWSDILGQLRTSDLLVLDPDDPQPGLDWAGAMIDGSPTGDEAAEFLDGSNLINPTPAKPEGTGSSNE